MYEPEYEFRILPHAVAPAFEFRDVNGAAFPVITGLAVPYFNGTPATETQIGTATFERVAPGAFAEALRRGDDVRALVNHNPDLLLGRTKSGTLRLWTDQRGLQYEIHPPPNALDKMATDAVRRGDWSGASFGFKADRQQYTSELRDGRQVTIRTLLSVTLGDVSLATYAAYRGTTATIAVPLTGPSVGSSASPTTPRLNIARRRLALQSGQ